MFKSLIFRSSLASSFKTLNLPRTFASHSQKYIKYEDKTLTGMLTLDNLKAQVKGGEIDTVCVCFPDHYGRLMGKRYEAKFFLDSVVDSGAHACDYLLVCDMNMNPRPGFKVANWETGYGDVHLVPDFNSLRINSWLDKTAMVICDVYDNDTDELVEVAPRSILLNSIKQLTASKNMILAASELEYHAYGETYRDAKEKDYAHLTPVSYYPEDYHMLQGTRNEIFNKPARYHLAKSGIPVETSKGEAGFGQHELNVKFSDIVTMADRHSVYKQCLKELADQLGMSVTFMAKPSEQDTGSSCHIHISLWDENCKTSLFYDPKATSSGNINVPNASEKFRWFLGGMLKYCDELMPFYAPTINSYKRYQSDSWAPIRIASSVDNRTAGFRIVGKGKSLRIENRIPGADANIYLAFSACVASGLEGIKQKIEPPPDFTGNIYEAKELPTVSKTLEKAVDKFSAKTSFARKAFGDNVVDHYTTHWNHEINAYHKHVSQLEKRWYFEQI